jgi:hypothetical protein
MRCKLFGAQFNYLQIILKDSVSTQTVLLSKYCFKVTRDEDIGLISQLQNNQHCLITEYQ